MGRQNDTTDTLHAMPLHKVGKVVFILGLSLQPLTASQVYRIEQRALAKLRRNINGNNHT